MRKLLLRSCLLSLLALSVAGQTDNWKKYDNKEGNFAVLFPDQPTDSVNASDENVKSHTLMVKDSGAVYTVVYTAMSTTQTVDDATFQVFKNAVFQELPKCAVEKEQAPAPVLNGYIGHWYRLTCDLPNNKVTVEGNIYWGKHYAYAVMTMYPASNARPQGEEKFLQSFSVLDPAK
jgi:hypothetical protein